MLQMENGFMILSDEQYNEVLDVVYQVMDKGEDNLTEDELNWLRMVAPIIEKYEDEVLLKD